MDQLAFKGYVFPKYKPETVIKTEMQRFDDPSLPDYAILDISALSKKEYKAESFEEEFIQSYVHAAKVLAKESYKDINKPQGYAILAYSYAVPILYLTRHSMELALKRALRQQRRKPREIHSLRRLYDSLTARMPPSRARNDRRAKKNMREFIKAIDELDPTGFGLRYATDHKGNFTQDKTLFVNCTQVVNYLEKFVEQLTLLNNPKGSR